MLKICKPITVTSEPTSRNAGFSALEAIVAVGLLGLVLVPLYALQLNIAGLARGIERQVQTVGMLEAALDELQTVHLDQNPEGEIAMRGGSVLRYKVQAASAPRRARSALGDESRYELTTFVIDYQLHLKGHEPRAGITVVTQVRATAPFALQ
jgi:hypothetical protein